MLSGRRRAVVIPFVVGKSSKTKTAGRSSDRGLYLADLTNRAHASIWDSYLGSLKSDGRRSKPKPSSAQAVRVSVGHWRQLLLPA